MRTLALLSLLALATPLAAQRGTTSTYAPGCNGGTLTGTFQPIAGGGGSELLVLQASGLHARSFGAMVWGFDPAMTPLPGGCILHVNPVWSITFVTDAQGNHVWQRAWPRTIGGEFRIQMGSLQASPFEVRTTNAILADSNN